MVMHRALEQEPAAKEWRHETARINELWQSGASRFFAPGRGHYRLVSLLDDYSRKILAWELVKDVQAPSLVEAIYGFSCITVTTVMQENLLGEPHAVRGRVSCIMGAPNHNARNSIEVIS